MTIERIFEYDGQEKTAIVTASLINNAEYTVVYYSDSNYTNKIDIPQMTNAGSNDYYFTISDNNNNYEIYYGKLILTVTGQDDSGSDTGDDSGDDNVHKSINIYRLYNKITGEHLLTAKENEYAKLGTTGWTQEGMTFAAYTEDNKPDDAIAIYRLFNPNGFNGCGDHHYTRSQGEINKLKAAGWELDFNGEAAFYVKGDISVYKLYDTVTGAHHYTAKSGEANKMVINGWKKEGISWAVEGYYNNIGNLISD